MQKVENLDYESIPSRRCIASQGSDKLFRESVRQGKMRDPQVFSEYYSRR